MEDFINALKGKVDLPNNSALLTFDDGYIDHYTQVLPVLMNNKLQGSFFIPARILKENSVLDVNKIHFILESCKDIKSLIDDYKELRPSDKTYFVSLAKAVNRQFRNSETMLRLLRGDKVEDVIAYLRTQKGVEELKLTNHHYNRCVLQ